MNLWNITPLDAASARAIAAWRYAGDCAVYDMGGTEEAARELLSGGYWAVRDDGGALTGFFCFGAPARVPTGNASVYAGDALDMGLGMAPHLCGRGQGAAFVRCGAAFARARLGARTLRLTVALFNARAITVYERVGFARQYTFERGDGTAFQTMTLEDEPRGSNSNRTRE